MPLAIGQVLHTRYRIVKLIGQGGFGAVYRAWDLSLKQPCAVKENLDASPEAQRQFEREATILAGLRHSNLPRVTDYFFLTGQGQYLVMDFIDGYNLVEAVVQNGGPLPESRALDWIEQVCGALTYLHTQTPSIIHRDIKPQNIIITPGGQAMLVDFGISKIFDPVLSTTGGARGVTPSFSPPEQYGRARTDPRSDLYTLSATLYYLLTAHEPPDAIERMVHSTPLTPPRQYNPAVTPGVEQAILCALEIESGRRFPSVKEFRDTLQTQPVTASVSSNYPPTPAAPQIRPLPPAQPPSFIATPPTQDVSLMTSIRPPRSVTIIAALCIITSLVSIISGVLLGEGLALWLILPIFFASLLGLVGGILMMQKKKAGRQTSQISLGLIAAISLFWGELGLGIMIINGSPDPISIWLSLISWPIFCFATYTFFYFSRTQIRDYFQVLEAPQSKKPEKILHLLGWLHIILGFWLVLPFMTGIGMLNKQNQKMYRLASFSASLFCLLALVGPLIFNDMNWGSIYTVRFIFHLLFILELQVWLYLRRPEVRQLYP